VWASSHTPADKAALIAIYRDLLAKESKDAPDPSLGRAVFTKTCNSATHYMA